MKIRRGGVWVAVLAIAAMLLLAAPAQAAPDARAQREIDHLLAFVASSECRFVRGGEEDPERHGAAKRSVARIGTWSDDSTRSTQTSSTASPRTNR